MVMEIQLFSKGKWNIGRPIVVEEIPWFKGKEVATSLQYSCTFHALHTHVEREDNVTYAELTMGARLPDAL